MPDPHFGTKLNLLLFPILYLSISICGFHPIYPLLAVLSIFTAVSCFFPSLIHNNYLKQKPSRSRGYRGTRMLDTEQTNQFEHACTRRAYSKESKWKALEAETACLFVGVGSFSSIFCFLLLLIPFPVWFKAKCRILCIVFFFIPICFIYKFSLFCCLPCCEDFLEPCCFRTSTPTSTPAHV